MWKFLLHGMKMISNIFFKFRFFVRKPSFKTNFSLVNRRNGQNWALRSVSLTQVVHCVRFNWLCLLVFYCLSSLTNRLHFCPSFVDTDTPNVINFKRATMDSIEIVIIHCCVFACVFTNKTYIYLHFWYGYFSFSKQLR